MHALKRALVPNPLEIGRLENAAVINDLIVVEDAIDGAGSPFGLQKDGFAQQGVVLEVQADAEIVEEAPKAGLHRRLL